MLKKLHMQIVALYLLEKYAPHSKLLPSTPELRAQARAAARVVDVYMTPIQVCRHNATFSHARQAYMHPELAELRHTKLHL